VLDVALAQERHALLGSATAGELARLVRIPPPCIVAVGQEVPIDRQAARGPQQGLEPALREGHAANALAREVVPEHTRELGQDPELRFAFDEQPDAREHRDAAVHTQVVREAPQVRAGQRARTEPERAHPAFVPHDAPHTRQRHRRERHDARIVLADGDVRRFKKQLARANRAEVLDLELTQEHGRVLKRLSRGARDASRPAPGAGW
jgi:hypothetical protein